MPDIVNFNHMRVGQKGGGKHWTEAEVTAREAASKKFERKKSRLSKYPAG